MYKLIALILGWRAAYDSEDGKLVVYRNSRHFIGDKAWRNAVLIGEA